MRKKRAVLAISIIIFLAIAGVLALFRARCRTPIVRTDLKRTESNKAEQVKEMTLSNIDMDIQGVYFYDTGWITNYSQVEDGHYY